ncbi:MAG: hypothetical protein LQ352_001402 [Teloschistes flavicans]|nr:MAG: hypothetical protein LQ352_001402 [Teloschistes flavicans]
MHSTDETGPFPEKRQRWKKCPICWDSVYVSETRPVRWFAGQEGDPPQEGCDIVLRLIERSPGSTLALPRDGATSHEKDENVPWYFAAEVMDYARVMKGGEDYMTTEYDREIEDLRQQEREDELIFGEETQWTQKAVAAISELKARLKGLGNPPDSATTPNERKPRRAPLKYHDHHTQSPDFYLAQHALKPGQPPPESTLRAGQMEVSQTQPSSTSTPTSDSPATSAGARATNAHSSSSPFFFYEALLHFYLSPLDIRILRSAFGEFSSFPSTILPRVERVSTGHIVDDDLRRRAKYLTHLPRGCEVAFLECDWTDVVGTEVLGGFSVEIEKRRKRNREKEAREEKERARAEKEEDDKRWAAARRRRPALSPVDLAFAESHFPATQVGSELVSSSVDSGFTSSSPPWRSSHFQAGSAFATLASPSTSPVAPRTVWGTAAVASSSSSPPPVPLEPKPPEDDGWLQNWETDLLREDDLSMQLAANSIESSTAKAATAPSNSRKKKGKKITLMSTNARRGA